jgi:hypothetical protein
MSYIPGDSLIQTFDVVSITGALANADSTTGICTHNGTDDGTVTVTVTNTGTGRYKAVFTIPVGYVAGDSVGLSIAATVGGVATGVTFGPWVLDSKRWANVINGNGNVPASVNQWQLSTQDNLPAVSVAAWDGQAVTVDGNNQPIVGTVASGVNTTKWAGGTIPAPNVTGVPLVDWKYILGSAITGTAATIAAAWSKAWNVVSSAWTSADVNQTGDAYGRLVSGITGPSPVTITFVDSNNNPVANVPYTVAGQGSGQANSSGVATFGLPNGMYTLTAQATAGVVFPVTAVTVSGTTAQTITGPAASSPIIPAAGQTVVSGKTINQQGVAVPNAVVTFRVKYQLTDVSVTSDGSGSFSIALLQSANYSWATPTGSSNYFSTTTATTLNLGNLIGEWV